LKEKRRSSKRKYTSRARTRGSRTLGGTSACDANDDDFDNDDDDDDHDDEDGDDDEDDEDDEDDDDDDDEGTLTGVSWSLLYCAKAPDAPSFNRLSLLSRTLTSLNTSLNSPGGECNIKSETIRTFSWSGIAASPSAAILPFPLARTLRRHRRRCQKRGYGAVVTDRSGCAGSLLSLSLALSLSLSLFLLGSASRGAARSGASQLLVCVGVCVYIPGDAMRPTRRNISLFLSLLFFSFRVPSSRSIFSTVSIYIGLSFFTVVLFSLQNVHLPCCYS